MSMKTLYARIDMETTPVKITIKPVTDRPIEELDYWLEVVSALATNAMKHEELHASDMVSYCTEYITRHLDTYKREQ